MSKISRIFHTWDKWECYPAGFYENQAKGKTRLQCEDEYAEFLGSSESFSAALDRLPREWPNSCEHYLTNEKMNRIAWLGQAAACLAMGLPSCYRSGYFKLSPQQRSDADLVALEHLNKWLADNGYETTTLEGAGVSATANIY